MRDNLESSLRRRQATINLIKLLFPFLLLLLLRLFLSLSLNAPLLNIGTRRGKEDDAKQPHSGADLRPAEFGTIGALALTCS